VNFEKLLNLKKLYTQPSKHPNINFTHFTNKVDNVNEIQTLICILKVKDVNAHKWM